MIFFVCCLLRFAEAYLSLHGSPLGQMSVLPGPETRVVMGLAEEPSVKKIKQTKTVLIKRQGTSLTISAEDMQLAIFMKALLIVMKQVPFKVYKTWDSKKFLQFNSVDFSQETKWYDLLLNYLF